MVFSSAHALFLESIRTKKAHFSLTRTTAVEVGHNYSVVHYSYFISAKAQREYDHYDDQAERESYGAQDSEVENDQFIAARGTFIYSGCPREKVTQIWLGPGSTGCHKKVVPRLCCFCGGVVDSIISGFVQLHRLGFNVKFETLYELI